MAKERKAKHFIKQPTYLGGTAALKKIIRENQRYPEAALVNNIEGTVVVRYTINHKGTVIEAKVISGIGHGCDEEAKRLVKLLKFEVPKHRGMNIKFHKQLKIHFRKPKVKKLEQQKAPDGINSPKVTYTIARAKKNEGNKNNRASSSYSYKINF